MCSLSGPLPFGGKSKRLARRLFCHRFPSQSTGLSICGDTFVTTTKLLPFRELAWFAERVQEGRYALSEHVVRALMGGAISVPDVEIVLQTGRVLEEHRHAKRGFSYLVAGRVENRFIHLRCAQCDGFLVVVFAYKPTLPIWENALRRAPAKENEMNDVLATCYFCGGAMKKITVGNFDYRLEGSLYVIKRVPASLCLECGEKYIDAEVGRRMNELIATRAFTTTEQVGVIEYQ